MSRPFLLGLTGSIGMGKSTTGRMFVEHGFGLWDADGAVHRLYASGGAGVEAVRAICPEAVRDGAVDRGILAGRIAEDPGLLARIEEAVHPLVAEDRARFVARATEPVIVLDIPLLFETGAEEWLDSVAVVSAPAEEQRRRVMARPGMTEEKFELIRARQVPDAEKRRRADYVIDTSSIEAARSDVQDIVAELRERHDDT